MHCLQLCCPQICCTSPVDPTKHFAYQHCILLQEGASLTATLLDSSTQAEQAAAVRHIGDGVYEVASVLETAGNCCLSVKLDQSCHPSGKPATGQAPQLQAQVVCVPAAVWPESCTVELQTQPWVASQPFVVHVHRHDR